MSPFAEQLRRFRERAALTQEELAARAGLTGKAVGALERGERRRPYAHTVRALADALGLDDVERDLLTTASRPPDGTPACTVPSPVTPVIGRDAERDEIVDLLRSGETRLLTLTGPGGVGKTSLALDVARTLADEFPGAVAVVELAPLRESGLVLAAVARAVGAEQLSPPLLDGLASYLGTRRRLVVLDNLEHLLDAASDVAALLARCPGLVVLATSRAALRLRAERERPLEPLRLPVASSAAAVAASPAAQVFLERARAAGRPITLTDTAAADVAAICRRMDGLPLALELAAAHARFLPLAALLGRLDSTFSPPGARDLPARQRTVRATLDWSHALLTADEQRLLRRLAVFAGGFSLDAAQQVGGEGRDVVPALAGLVQQSLLVPESDRYRMLEPVRQYAEQRLEAAGEHEAVAERAADFFADLASSAREGLRTDAQAEWLDRLHHDHDNLSRALRRLVDRRVPGRVAMLGADIWLYWALRGHIVEGIGWMEQLPADLAPTERAAQHVALAGLRFAAGDVAGTADAARSAADAARSAGDGQLLAQALVLLASAAIFVGAAGEAEAALAEIAGPAVDGWVRAHAALARAQLLFATGQVGETAVALHEAERLARELGSPFTLATFLNVQGSAALAADDDDAALAWYAEAAAVAAEVGSTWTLVYTMPGLAVVAARKGLLELATELFAAGSATAEAGEVAVTFPPDLESAGATLPAIQAKLGEEAFRRAWERGRVLRQDDVPRLAGVISDRLAPG